MTFYFYRSHVNADGQWVYKNAAGQEVLAGNGYYDPRDGSIHIDLKLGKEASNSAREHLSTTGTREKENLFVINILKMIHRVNRKLFQVQE